MEMILESCLIHLAEGCLVALEFNHSVGNLCEALSCLLHAQV